MTAEIANVCPRSGLACGYCGFMGWVILMDIVKLFKKFIEVNICKESGCSTLSEIAVQIEINKVIR